MKLGLVTTVAEMFSSNLVNITSFASLHFGVEDMVELENCHWRDRERFITEKVKDIEVVELAEFVEPLVKDIVTLIRPAKMFSISSKTFKNIFVMIGSHRSMEHICHGTGGVATAPLHDIKDFAPVALIKMHDVVVVLYTCEVIFVASKSLEI